MVSRAFYRVGQLRRALNPRVTPSERRAAKKTLGDGLYPLFESMSTPDQRHCLDLFEKLLESGHTEPAVLRTALIHDCGKGHLAGARIGIADRVAYVMLSLVPLALSVVVRLKPGLKALQNHGERALELAREHNAEPEVMALLEQMEDRRPLDDLGRALKRADDAT